MRVCQHCGKDNQEHYKFCLGCGGEIGGDPPASSTVDVVADRPAAGVFCSGCGARVQPGFTFCGQCGGRVGDAPAPGGRLTLIRPDGTEGGGHALSPGVNVIGRSHGALFETDQYLSPTHAELDLGAGGLMVRDRESLNGVFVKIGGEEEIVDGEIFRVGQELLRFEILRTPAPLTDGTEIMGSPNPGYWGRVSLVVGRDQEGAAYPLLRPDITIGRERGDILFPADGYVSGSHARLISRGGRFLLVDLNSSNGTFLRVRGDRAVPTGSYLLLGQQLFRVQY